MLDKHDGGEDPESQGHDEQYYYEEEKFCNKPHIGKPHSLLHVLSYAEVIVSLTQPNLTTVFLGAIPSSPAQATS